MEYSKWTSKDHMKSIMLKMNVEYDQLSIRQTREGICEISKSTECGETGLWRLWETNIQDKEAILVAQKTYWLITNWQAMRRQDIFYTTSFGI